MILEIILALLVGILAGTFTGLIPGIHINLIAVVLITNITYFQKFSPLIPVTFIVSMSITHTFLDFLPSIFLGAPEEDTFLSILPGHEMLKSGLAHEAIILTLYGSLLALPVILLFTPVFIFIIPALYSKLKLALPFILIFLSLYLVLREKNFFLSTITFILAGFLGFATLNLPIKQPLLPLLTGLFGTSALIISLKQKTKIPKQSLTPLKKTKLTKPELIRSTIGAIISAPFCSFFPGIGSGHAAVIGSEFIKQSKKGFLTLLGAINTIVMGLSFITIFAIGKTRTGSAVAVSQILEAITPIQITLILITIIITGIIAFLLAINLSKLLAKNITKVPYSIISIFILITLLIINLIFSNFLGIIVLLTSTALGIFTILSGARRINLMGSLLIPTIIFYLS